MAVVAMSKTAALDVDRCMAKSKSGKKTKLSKKSRIINTLCMVFFFLVFLGCAVYLFQYFWQIKKSEDEFDDLKAMIVEDDAETDDTDENVPEDEDGDTAVVVKSEKFVTVNGKSVLKKFEKLYGENSDFIGWITIDGTKIDYPVMQTPEDEEYYINRDFDGNYSSSGTLFIDTNSDVEKPSDVLLIYGHNMKAGNMFHGLLDFEDEDFYEEHKYIDFDTIYGSGTYVVIAAFRDQIYDEDYTGIKYYDFFDAKDAEEFDGFVSYCKSRTSYNITETAEYGDKLICLSTCAYHSENGRFVVLAKKVD
jgi:sortase B